MVHCIRRTASWITAIAGPLLFVAGPASALTLTLLSDDRAVAVDCLVSCSAEAVPDAPFTPWSTSLSGASQLSAIDLTGMSGSGGASSTSIIYASSSIFSVTFSTDELALFSLTGSVGAGATEEHNPSGISGSSGVRLSGEGGVRIVSWGAASSPSGSGQAFDWHGFLAPGTYTMFASASSAGVGADWSFDLGLTPLPEPSCLVLAGAALLAVGLRRSQA